MSEIVVLCVEDEPEVRDVLLRDLQPFAAAFRIEPAEDVEDARAVVAECLDAGASLGLVLCDHVLPGTKGADYLVELERDPRTAAAAKVLVTGRAGLEDTVKAVNEAGLDHYVAKPWTPEELHAVVREQLTEYVIAHAEDLLPYVRVLDGPRLMEALRERKAGE